MILGSADFGTKAHVQLAEVLFAKVWICLWKFQICVLSFDFPVEYVPSPSMKYYWVSIDSAWSDPLNTKAGSGGTSGQVKQVLMNKHNAKYVWSC